MPDMAAVFSADNVRLALIELATLILCISVHEFGHAFVADRLGDHLPRAQGRVTLNPIAHIDPIGTIALPLLAFFLAAGGSGLSQYVIGWGKPVQVSLNPRTMTRRFSIRTSDVLISVAGPFMNILLAAIFSVVFIGLLRFDVNDTAIRLVANVIGMNLGLMMFNLLPCPPLDGGHVLIASIPARHPAVDFLRRYGQFIFLLLVFSGMLRVIMRPMYMVTDWWLHQLLRWAP